MRSIGASLKSSTTPSPPVTGLPLEIVEMIIAYFIYDMRSLRACSNTCYPWYIAAVPHLHHALHVDINSFDQKFRWPNPVQNMHVLGLLPLVKSFSIRRGSHSGVGFSPELFSYRTLRQFSALTGIRTLWIADLDIPSFMPMIRQYFGHLFPTVQILTLREPKGSDRQIIYFIGMFQHLEDLQLFGDGHRVNFQGELADDLILLPPSAPPLRGRLMLENFTRINLLKDMIDLFGGIRFRGMDLFNVDGMPLLLNACAKTLETFWLHPQDPRGEVVYLKCVQSPADSFTARSSLQSFDLSRNKSLRALQVPARSVDRASRGDSPDTALNFLKYVLSTIASAAFFELVVLYWDYDFRGVQRAQHSVWPHIRELSQAERAEETSRHHKRFELLREVHNVRGFQLVLCADVWGPNGEYSVRMLRQAVAHEKMRDGFYEFSSDPSVTCYLHKGPL